METTAGLAAPQLSRPRSQLVGTLFACVATFMVFISVVGIYIAERSAARAQGTEWFPPDSIGLGPSGFVFWTLVLSAFTVQWAVQAIKTDDRTNAYIALALTALFGAAIFNQLWFIIGDSGFALSANTAQFLFFLINGMFIVVLIAAVVFVAFTCLRALAGQFGPRNYQSVASAAMFWHMVVLMWSIVYYLIYITR